MSELTEAVRNRIAGYLNLGVRVSILRNSHMNDFTENQEAFDEEMVPGLIEKLVEVSPLSSWRGGAVLDALVAGAKIVRKESGLPWKQTTIDAVLVDFINYCGNSACIDYGLYTCDIQKS